MVSFCYTYCSMRGDVLGPVPLRKTGGLVSAQDQIQRRFRVASFASLYSLFGFFGSLRIFGAQLNKGVYGVSGAAALGFARIHERAWQAIKRQVRHCQPMHRAAEWPAFVPGLAGGQHMQHIKLQLLNGALRQGHMRQMRGVESAAKNAYFQAQRRAGRR